MRKLSQYLLISSLVVILTACAGAGRKERSKFLQTFQTKQFEQALSYLDSNDFYKEEKSRLLYLLERGTVLHNMGQYKRSIETFEKAKDLSRKLYTVSISGKLKKAIANDSYDKYYGESYERSHIHFYLALNHFLLYQKGETASYTIKAKKSGEKDQVVASKKLTDQERRTELMAARAEIAAWDSMLTTLKDAKGAKKSVFKNDLLAKTFGAYIHEAVGTRNDDQIALQLYKDAKDLLFKNYNSYKTFNTSNKKFIKDFVKLKKMRLSEVEKNYVVSTSFQKQLKNYLDYKILSLTKRIRPGDYKRQIKVNSPDSSIVAKVKEEGKSVRNNVGIVFQKGLIPAKVAEKHYYGLGAVINDPNSSEGAKAAASIGSAVFSVFAAKQLGLLPPPTTYNPGAAYVGIKVAEAAVNTVAIKFELPKIANRPINDKAVIKILNEAGEEVKNLDLVVINPLGDIAEQAITENSAARFTRTGLRVAGKHVAAIAGAYATYKAMKNKNKFLAKLAAMGAYAAASKGIENSEKADTRYWSTLPGDLRFADTHLDIGKYKVQLLLQDVAKGTQKVMAMGDLEVTDVKKKHLLNLRTMY